MSDNSLVVPSDYPNIARVTYYDPPANQEFFQLLDRCNKAIKHDQQPYPTAEAYEKVCMALERRRIAMFEMRIALANAEKKISPLNDSPEAKGVRAVLAKYPNEDK